MKNIKLHHPPVIKARLILEDGSCYEGISFGYPCSVAGEVVFNTGMVGYPESLTDPSYFGQILILAYPLIGNYGVPPKSKNNGLDVHFESTRIHVQALLVSDYSHEYYHWKSQKSLGDWLFEQKIPALTKIDTRALTKKLREKGTMLGKIQFNNEEIEFYDPDADQLVEKVSIKRREYMETVTAPWS